MKLTRRIFLKLTGAAVALAAIPFAPLSGSEIAPVSGATRYDIEKWIRESLRKHMEERMDEVASKHMYSGSITRYSYEN